MITKKTKQKTVLLACSIITGIFFLNVSSVSAETATTSMPALRKEFKEVRKDIRQIASSTRNTILQNAKDAADAIRADVASSTRASTTAALKENRAMTKEALEANRASTTAAIKAKRDDLKKALMVRKAEKNEKKMKLSAEARGRVQILLNNVYNRLMNQVQRLTKVDSHLNEKINSLAASGKDVSASKELLTTAQNSFTSARIAIEATRGLSIELSATTTSKEILKEIAKKAETQIKNTADSYKKVADSLKPFLSTDAQVTISASSTNQ